MSKYKDLIFPDEKAVDKERKEEAIADAKMDTSIDIHAATKTVALAQKALLNAKRGTGNNFSTKNIIQKQVELEEAQDNLTRLEALQKELF